jgi:hypothetical protein
MFDYARARPARHCLAIIREYRELGHPNRDKIVDGQIDSKIRTSLLA